MPLCEPFANRMVERSRVDLWHLAVTQLTIQDTWDHSSRASSIQIDAPLVAQKSLFVSREMDGTKPLIRYASPTCLLSLHKGSATKCYHHHDFKTQTATGFNFIREHFLIFFPSLFSWLLATVVQPSIFRIRSPGGPLLPGLAFGGALSGAEEGLANGRWSPTPVSSNRSSNSLCLMF